MGSQSPTHDGLAAAVLDSLPDATAVLDGAGRIIAVNRAWRMYALDNGGTDDHTGVGVNYLQVCLRSATAGCEDAAQVAGLISDVLAGRCVDAELEYPCPSPAADRWFLVRISKLDGPIVGAVMSHVNMTRRKRAETELAHAASHDSLTGLANRVLFARRLAKAIRPKSELSARTATAGVLYIDLDGFKPVNDTYGHSVGDEVLLTVARRLRDTVRPGDTSARLGGDEFGVLAPRIDSAGLAALAARIERRLSEPHTIHGQPVAVSGSVGTHLARTGEQVDEVLHAADQAMYTNKRAAR